MVRLAFESAAHPAGLLHSIHPCRQSAIGAVLAVPAGIYLVIPCQASQAGRLGEAGDLSSIPTGLLSVAAAGVAAGLFEGIICEFLLLGGGRAEGGPTPGKYAPLRIMLPDSRVLFGLPTGTLLNRPFLPAAGAPQLYMETARENV